MNLLHLFDHSLLSRRDDAALEWAGETYTFGDIEARSNRVANALRERGFAKGDRLCVYLANRIELIDLYLACVKLGVIFVPVNILYRDREIAHITGDAEPKLFLDAPIEPSDDATRPNVPLDGDTPAAIIYTSGTTGVSKGAVLTHNNFLANTVNLLTSWQITDRDRFLLALPLFHIHALGNGLHCWLVSGCRMRLLERFDHRTALDDFTSFEPTLFFGVPTVYVRLLETPSDVARAIGATMRLFVSGSAPLPAHVLERFRDLFGHTILERYGMTETFMNISNPYAGERRAGTVGVPLPGVSVRIEESELFVRGPNVFAGYWRRPDATAAAFTSDGFFRTGDLAQLSDDGYYTLLCRKSDLIISGGFTSIRARSRSCSSNSTACAKQQSSALPMKCAAKSRSHSSSATSTPRSSSASAAISWPASKCHADSKRWSRFRARRWAKFRNTCSQLQLPRLGDEARLACQPIG